MGFVSKAQLRGRWSGPTLGTTLRGRTRRGPQDSCGPPHRLQLPETSVLLLAGSGQERRDGGRGEGSQGQWGAQTDTQTREWKTGGGSQLVERRRRKPGNKGSSCHPASLPQDRPGLSVWLQPALLAGPGAESWADTGVSEGEGA